MMLLQNISRVALSTLPSGYTFLRYVIKICIEEVQYFGILVWLRQSLFRDERTVTALLYWNSVHRSLTIYFETMLITQPVRGT